MKSFLAVILLSLLFANGSSAGDFPDIPGSPPGSVLSAPGGRFVFGQISQRARDTYMLDTQTGQLWQIMTVGTNGASRLFQIYYDVIGTTFVADPSQIQDMVAKIVKSVEEAKSKESK